MFYHFQTNEGDRIWKIESEFASAQLKEQRLNKLLIEIAKLFEKKHGDSINIVIWRGLRRLHNIMILHD